jgi:hypothetical protein
MYDNTACEFLLPIHLVAEFAVKSHVLSEELVGVKPGFIMPKRRRHPFGMSHQFPAQAAPLKGRRHRHILDQQMVGLRAWARAQSPEPIWHRHPGQFPDGGRIHWHRRPQRHRLTHAFRLLRSPPVTRPNWQGLACTARLVLVESTGLASHVTYCAGIAS